MARIRWILVIAYITALFAVASCCQAEVIQHGTEEFCQLSGLVYHDLNNDGTRGEKEWLIPDIEITLTGISTTGESIVMTTTTGNTGTYTFSNIPAGTYEVQETQPEILHTAMANPVGTAGGAAPDPNRFVDIQLEPATLAKNYNFGEWGLKAKYMSKRDFILVPVLVPEPATLSMLGMLVGGIAFYGFRRRRR